MQQNNLCRSCHVQPSVESGLCRECMCNSCHRDIKYEQSNFCSYCVCQSCLWNKRASRKFCNECANQPGGPSSNLVRGPEATDFRRGGTYAGIGTLHTPCYPVTLTSGVNEQELLDTQNPMMDPPLPVAGGSSVTEAPTLRPPVQEDARGERVGTLPYQTSVYDGPTYQTTSYRTTAYEDPAYQNPTGQNPQGQVQERDEDDYQEDDYQEDDYQEDDEVEKTPRPTQISDLQQFAHRHRGGGSSGFGRWPR